MASSSSTNSDEGVVPVVSVNSMDSPSNESRRGKRKLDFDATTGIKSGPSKSPTSPWFSSKSCCNSVLVGVSRKESPRPSTEVRIDVIPEPETDHPVSGVRLPSPEVRRYPPYGVMLRRRVRRIPRRPVLQSRVEDKPKSPPLQVSTDKSDSPTTVIRSHSSIADLIVGAKIRNLTHKYNQLLLRMQEVESQMEDVKQEEKCPCIGRDCCAVGKKKSVQSHLTPMKVKHEISFKAWYYSPKPWQRPRHIVPNKELSGVTREWFRKIYGALDWLEDEHMDALFVLMARSKNPSNRIWPHNWTVLETKCWEALIQDDFSLVREIVMPYALGLNPKKCGKQWSEVAKAYSVGNTGRNHWFLYELSFVDQKIIIYDSMSKYMSYSLLEEPLSNLMENIPKLLEAAEDNASKGYFPAWEVERYSDPPQQLNGSDCGLMVVEYLRCLIDGRPVDDVEPVRAVELRAEYCALLYGYGQDILAERGRR